MPGYGKMMSNEMNSRSAESRPAVGVGSVGERDMKARSALGTAVPDRGAARLTMRPMKRTVRR